MHAERGCRTQVPFGAGYRELQPLARDEGDVLSVSRGRRAAAVTSRLGVSPTVERTEEWTRDLAGAGSPLTFEFSGLPVTCEGTARLAPAGSGSRMDVDLTLRVDVPLFGGAVERAVTPRIVAALDAEAAFYDTLDD